jgi:hypothetical protein
VRYSQLPGGDVKVVVKAKGFKPFEATVKTEAGAAAELEVKLEKE